MYRRQSRHRRNFRKIGSLSVYIPNMTYNKFYGMMRSMNRIKGTLQNLRRTTLKTKLSIEIRQLGLSVQLKN